jgi:hypothetical protein
MEALIALIGVVVGAVLTGAVDCLRESLGQGRSALWLRWSTRASLDPCGEQPAVGRKRGEFVQGWLRGRKC